MKNLFYTSIAAFLLSTLVYSGDNIVGITENIPYVDVIDSGTKIRIERIQDIDNKLTDDYSRTSRLCPPHCLAPQNLFHDVKNIEELELLKFMQTEVMDGTGYVVDSREPFYFDVETIPTAINIPYSMVQPAKPEKIYRLFKILGAKINQDGTIDYSNAKNLAVFCNGPWCLSSRKFLTKIIKAGYPQKKLLYYRSGFQGWKLLGLTTTVRTEYIK